MTDSCVERICRIYELQEERYTSGKASVKPEPPTCINIRLQILEQIAEMQDSGLYCSACDTHLPNTGETYAYIHDKADTDLQSVRWVRFCPMCKNYFDNDIVNPK
jgi:hypothetical protein